MVVYVVVKVHHPINGDRREFIHLIFKDGDEAQEYIAQLNKRKGSTSYYILVETVN